jgi:hypothetical protein
LSSKTFGQWFAGSEKTIEAGLLAAAGARAGPVRPFGSVWRQGHAAGRRTWESEEKMKPLSKRRERKRDYPGALIAIYIN